MSLRFAMIGAGGIAAVHIKHMKELGEQVCRLTHITVRPQDRQPGQVEAFAAEGITVHEDGLEMIRATAGKVDAVFIPTSTYTHCELTCAALAAGHNVYLEKPAAPTVQEVDKMLAAEAASGGLCLLGYQYIHSHPGNFIKRRLVDGRLGRPNRVRAWAYTPRPDVYYARNEWAGQLQTNGQWVLDGPSMNALSHATASILSLSSTRERTFAAPVRVRAEYYHARPITSEDTCSIEILTDTGVNAYFIVSHCVEPPLQGPWMQVECENGHAAWNWYGAAEIHFNDGTSEYLSGSVDDNHLLPTLRSFCHALERKDRALLGCTLANGRNVIATINAAFESSRVVRPIPADLTRRVPDKNGSPITVVEGLREAIAQCGAQGKLFSDIGCPWAVATQPFDLTGYKQFPQQFGK